MSRRCEREWRTRTAIICSSSVPDHTNTNTTYKQISCQCQVLVAQGKGSEGDLSSQSHSLCPIGFHIPHWPHTAATFSLYSAPVTCSSLWQCHYNHIHKFIPSYTIAEKTKNSKKMNLRNADVRYWYRHSNYVCLYLSVRPSVCHVPVLYRNGWIYHHRPTFFSTC